MTKLKAPPQPDLSEVLSLSLRPKTLSAFYGQNATVAAIRKQVMTRAPRTWMFVGEPGSGKTSIARVLAVSYQCSHMTADKWGDPCAACYDNWHGFSIHYINASKDSGVADMERISEMAAYGPGPGSLKRVFILDEFQRASKDAQNLMLTPFEEPPRNTVWILCTTDPQKILPALRQRCTTYTMKPLSGELAEKFVTRAASKAGTNGRDLKPLIEQLDNHGVGSPRQMLQALEKYLAGATPVASVMSVDGSNIDTYTLCKSVTSGDWSGVVRVMDKATPEDSRLVRAAVAGWLRACMKRESNPAKLDRFVSAMQDITSPSPWDDAMMSFWLWGILAKATGRFARQ